MRGKRILSFLLLLNILAAIGSFGGFAEEKPRISVSSAQGAVGEDITVTVSMENVQGMTSADITLYYNPYVLYFKELKLSDTLASNNNVVTMFTEQLPKGAKNEYGELQNYCVMTVLHLEEFPQSLNNCDLATVTFEALAAGESPLILAANSFYLREDSVAPDFNSGMITVTGEKQTKEVWNYAQHADREIMYTDAAYTFEQRTGAVETKASQENASQNSSNKETANPIPKKNYKKTVIFIVAAVVVAIAAIAVAATLNTKKKIIQNDAEQKPSDERKGE